MANKQEFVLERIIRVKHNPLENRKVEIDERRLIGIFNELTERCNADKMALMSKADVYHAVKAGNKKFIKGIRKDAEKGWVVLNPFHNYKKNGLADIVHYEGSSAVKPVICRDIAVLYYDYVPLYDVLETQEGLVYFQVCDGTNDKAKAIKRNYYELSGVTADKTFVETPDAESRIEAPKRASGFYYEDGEFYVGGRILEFLDTIGRSRGVRVTKK